jgi:hypothetical protein
VKNAEKQGLLLLLQFLMPKTAFGDYTASTADTSIRQDSFLRKSKKVLKPLSFFEIL